MNTKQKFSIFKGFSFLFEDEGNTIKAWFSSFSGLEKVFINGNLLSSQRNYSKTSSTEFSIGENTYTTSLKTESVLKGPYVCTLVKNGKAIKRQRLVFPVINKKRKIQFLYMFIFYVIIALLFSYLERIYNLPKYYFYILVVIAISAVYIYELKSNRTKHTGMIIEDEEII